MRTTDFRIANGGPELPAAAGDPTVELAASAVSRTVRPGSFERWLLELVALALAAVLVATGALYGLASVSTSATLHGAMEPSATPGDRDGGEGATTGPDSQPCCPRVR